MGYRLWVGRNRIKKGGQIESLALTYCLEPKNGLRPNYGLDPRYPSNGLANMGRLIASLTFMSQKKDGLQPCYGLDRHCLFDGSPTRQSCFGDGALANMGRSIATPRS
jgi:hypothetical protein